MNKIIFNYEVIEFLAIIYKKELNNRIYVIVNKNIRKKIQKRIKKILRKFTHIETKLGFLFIVKGCDINQYETLKINEERFE